MGTIENYNPIIRIPVRITWVGRIMDKVYLWLVSRLFSLALVVFLCFPKRYRMSHNNGIAAKGKVRIVDNPTFPPHDFFEPGREFPARIRHAMVTYLDDAMPGVKSFSIKFSHDYLKSPFDLECNTGEISLFWSAASFLKFASLRKQAWGVQYAELYRHYPPSVAGAVATLRLHPTSYQNLRYYSKAPFLFVGKDGVKRYAKYKVKPYDDEPESGILENPDLLDIANQRVMPHETRSRNYLKDEFVQRVKTQGAKYMIQIQLRTASDDEDPLIFNNMIPWDEHVYPWQDLAVVDIDTPLDWNESLLSTFSLNNMPKSLGIIPAKSVHDCNSLNYMRAHSEMARKARLFSYKVKGFPPPIPDDDNRNTEDWGDAK